MFLIKIFTWTVARFRLSLPINTKEYIHTYIINLKNFHLKNSKQSNGVEVCCQIFSCGTLKWLCCKTKAKRKNSNENFIIRKSSKRKDQPPLVFAKLKGDSRKENNLNETFSFFLIYLKNSNTSLKRYQQNILREMSSFQRVLHQLYSENALPNPYEACNIDLLSRPTRIEKVKEKSIKILRNWQTINTNYRESKNPKFVFKLLCYNVLAQSLLENHIFLYKDHSKEHLQWERRWQNVKQEITEQDPDVFCMQEVQENHLIECYVPFFENLGYDFLYKRRTGDKMDGCAIFYKRNIMSLIEHETVEFNQSHATALDRDNVAIIAKFSPILYPKAEFIVATTHLLYNPRREDIRIVQTQMLLSELDRLAFKTENDISHPYVPIILTGDFNALPFTPVYNLITSGKLPYESAETMRKRFLSPHLGITDTCQHVEIIESRKSKRTNKNEEKRLIRLQNRESYFFPVRKPLLKDYNQLFLTGELSHQLAFQSVFKHKVEGKWEATTYQDQWVTVDYMFYSGLKTSNNKIIESKLKLISRYSIPTDDELYNVKIPNAEVGSDHLFLSAKFVLEE